MKVKNIIFVFVILSGCISISKAPKVNNDGYISSKYLGLIEASSILPYSMIDSSKMMRTITYDHVIKEMNEGRDVLLILNAVTCPFGEDYLNYIQKYYNLVREVRPENLDIIMIYENIALPYLTDLKQKKKYTFPFYFIIDEDHAGSYITKRQAFYSQLHLADSLYDEMKPLTLFYSNKTKTFNKRRGLQEVESLKSLTAIK